MFRDDPNHFRLSTSPLSQPVRLRHLPNYRECHIRAKRMPLQLSMLTGELLNPDSAWRWRIERRTIAPTTRWPRELAAFSHLQLNLCNTLHLFRGARPFGVYHAVVARVEMIEHRPFVFAIRDDLTGTVEFLGAVVDPLARQWTRKAPKLRRSRACWSERHCINRRLRPDGIYAGSRPGLTANFLSPGKTRPQSGTRGLL